MSFVLGLARSRRLCTVNEMRALQSANLNCAIDVSARQAFLYRRRADRHFRIHDVARQAEFRGLAAVHGAPGILVVRTIHLDDGRGEAGLGDV